MLLKPTVKIADKDKNHFAPYVMIDGNHLYNSFECSQALYSGFYKDKDSFTAWLQMNSKSKSAFVIKTIIDDHYKINNVIPNNMRIIYTDHLHLFVYYQPTSDKTIVLNMADFVVDDLGKTFDILRLTRDKYLEQKPSHLVIKREYKKQIALFFIAKLYQTIIAWDSLIDDYKFLLFGMV